MHTVNYSLTGELFNTEYWSQTSNLLCDVIKSSTEYVLELAIQVIYDVGIAIGLDSTGVINSQTPIIRALNHWNFQIIWPLHIVSQIISAISLTVITSPVMTSTMNPDTSALCRIQSYLIGGTSFAATVVAVTMPSSGWLTNSIVSIFTVAHAAIALYVVAKKLCTPAIQHPVQPVPIHPAHLEAQALLAHGQAVQALLDNQHPPAPAA